VLQTLRQGEQSAPRILGRDDEIENGPAEVAPTSVVRQRICYLETAELRAGATTAMIDR
jgi:hypothetical protein